jgi:hypothetical protein
MTILLIAQVVSQFAAVVLQMQDVLVNDTAGFFDLLSTSTSNFEVSLRIFRHSATASVVVMVLLVPTMWWFIFENWRSRIMDMRQGRSVAPYQASLCYCLNCLSRRYAFDRSVTNPSVAANFIGFQVALNVNLILVWCYS